MKKALILSKGSDIVTCGCDLGVKIKTQKPFLTLDKSYFPTSFFSFYLKNIKSNLCKGKKFWINPFFLNQKAPMIKLLQNYKKHGKMDWGLIPLKNNRDFVSFFFKISNPSTPPNTFFFHNPNQIRRLSTRCQEN